VSTIEIRGMENLRLILSQIEPTINAAIGAIALEIKGKIATYPPERPNSFYRRTGTLGRKWSVKKGSFSATIGNNTGYGPFVQDREIQAWMHKNRWQTTADVAEEYDPKVEKMLETEMQKVLSK
jgi:hypothetical protein